MPNNNSSNPTTPPQPPTQNPPPNNNPRDKLATLIVGGVAIAFVVSAIVPEHNNFAQLWQVVQPVFYLIIGYYFGARQTNSPVS